MMVHRSQQRGMTLVEVMIAVVLGSLVVLAVVNLFIGNNRNNRIQEGSSRIQENARYAVDLLATDLREAGFAGCRNFRKQIRDIATPAPATEFTLDNVIQGYNATGAGWTPALPADIAVLPGTDVIRTQRAVSCGATLTADMDNAPDNVLVKDNNCNFGPAGGDLVMIADCETAHIFRTTNASTSLAHGTFCLNTACLSGKKYGADAEVMKLETKTYFISRRGGLATTNPPALFEITNGGNANELVEGIDDMQVLYGVDAIGAGGVTGDDVLDDDYETANDVPDWSTVISARVSLLVASISDELLDGVTPAVVSPVPTSDGTILTPAEADKQLRRQFTATVNLRNKVQ